MVEETNPAEGAGTQSVFHSSLPLEIKLERAREELLDLSARNRLLNMPRSARTVRTIDVVDEKSSEIFRLLVRENRAFTFVPGRAASTGATNVEDDAEEIQELAQPEDESVDDRGILTRHADTKLQTRLTSAGLQKRLLDLYTDARTLEEEQGVNILFLTLGSLKWVDPINKENVRYAPLILIPVTLERASAKERFKLKARQEEIAANLSLEAFLNKLHSIKMPIFEAGDDFDPAGYIASVADAVSSKPGWEVNPDHIVLGFFSFAKFLMYRDLDPEVWPTDGRLTELPLIRSLLAEGFPHREGMIPEDAPIDPMISPAEMRHIVDADSSQTLAVHDARCGHNLVIQGPPGTGKSQTIANIIAAAVADGKTVLFVSEKMAALEVVKRRLDRAGVGDACLELHSNKANKRLLLEELRRAWELGSPRGDFPSSLHEKLEDARDALNDHAQRLHRRHAPSGLTPYQVMGELVRLRDAGQTPIDFNLERPQDWTADDRGNREKLLHELNQRLKEIGRPGEHPWWCVGLEAVLPMQVDRFVQRIGALKTQLTEIASEQIDLARILEMPASQSLREFGGTAEMARRVATAPDGFGECLGVDEWARIGEVAELLRTGGEYARLTDSLSGRVSDLAWTADVQEPQRIMAALPPNLGEEAIARFRRLHVLLPQVKEAAEQLRHLLGISGYSTTVDGVQRILEIGQHVAAAPTVSPDAFTAAVWDHGVEQAGDLVNAVAVLEAARMSIGRRLAESAWDADCRAARQALATHGASFFRFLSGDWRRANRLVKSLLNPPEMPLGEVIPLLDTLIKGQNALAAIKNGDSLGRSAFGSQWRGDRSNANELRSLLEWMRGLGPLAKEIRAVASQGKNQPTIGVSANCLQTIWDECDPLLEAAQRDLGWTEVSTLDAVLQRCSEISRADAACKELLTTMPQLAGECAAILARLMSCQHSARAVAAGTELGQQCFGSHWSGTRSSWPVLSAAARWIGENRDIRALASRIQNRQEIAQRAGTVESVADKFEQDAQTLFADLRLDQLRLLGTQEIGSVTIERLQARFDVWFSNPEQLSKWIGYKERADRGRALGLGELVDRLQEGRLNADASLPAFQYRYFEAILEDQVRETPELGRFDGHLHDGLTSEFAELDQQRIRAAQLEVVRAHHRRIPPKQGGGIGPLGVLRAEIAKRRGHIPIRQLMMKAAPAIQAIKPVVMMSPLSVAQFLTPGQQTFDLLVMDEASQIQPVDALGAIARCRQVVVVGDERQLPPTKFFSKMTGAQPEEDDNEAAQVADIESILGLFSARGMPQRMLRWHYRSRHQSLIAVSNTQFYENKLFIVPSPYTAEAGRGLRFHHVRDGRFDSGKTRTNIAEARVVAEAVIRHAKTHPEQSLGVAAFSASQTRAIRDQVELLRRVNPDADPFFQGHPGEQFFIKNLENVQGDERDVIFISVGYGKDSQGRMIMAFGPLSAEGGERRLNVLISRAKLRCEVFASITDEDIDLERGKGRGVAAFKYFLNFARQHSTALATFPAHSDSLFEAQVAKALEERGYEVHPKVGIAGILVDLAVADAERPGRYLLGIECDGVSYNNARSACDRDRIRHMALRNNDWIMHRIWSTDWFQRPKEQLERVVAAIEAARNELESRGERSRATVSVDIVTIDRVDGTEIDSVDPQESVSPDAVYKEASPARPHGWLELHETPTNILADLVAEIVKIESPVHLDEITARVRSVWDLQRSGVRIQSAVGNAVAYAVQFRGVELEDQFVFIPGEAVKVRDRSEVSSANLRKPEMLPPQEIREGVLQVVRANLGAGQDEVVQAVARLLGFKTTSAQLREVIESAIFVLIADGRLAQQGAYLVLVESAEASGA